MFAIINAKAEKATSKKWFVDSIKNAKCLTRNLRERHSRSCVTPETKRVSTEFGESVDFSFSWITVDPAAWSFLLSKSLRLLLARHAISETETRPSAGTFYIIPLTHGPAITSTPFRSHGLSASWQRLRGTLCILEDSSSTPNPQLLAPHLIISISVRWTRHFVYFRPPSYIIAPRLWTEALWLSVQGTGKGHFVYSRLLLCRRYIFHCCSLVVNACSVVTVHPGSFLFFFFFGLFLL